MLERTAADLTQHLLDSWQAAIVETGGLGSSSLRASGGEIHREDVGGQNTLADPFAAC